MGPAVGSAAGSPVGSAVGSAAGSPVGPAVCSAEGASVAAGAAVGASAPGSGFPAVHPASAQNASIAADSIKRVLCLLLAALMVFALAVGSLQRCLFKKRVISILLPTLPFILLQLIKLFFDYTYQFDFGRIIVMLIGFFAGYYLINAVWGSLSKFFYKQTD